MKPSLLRLNELYAGALVICALEFPAHKVISRTNVLNNVKEKLLCLPERMKRKEHKLDLICDLLMSIKQAYRSSVASMINIDQDHDGQIVIPTNYVGVTTDVILNVFVRDNTSIVTYVSGKSETIKHCDNMFVIVL